jgi:PIN domain nuclease of toxin-antitoxin system
MLNLDTHIVLYSVSDTLRTRERTLLLTDRWGISAVVIWEIERLARLGRIDLSPRHPALRRILERITVFDVTPEVAGRARDLDFHSNPCDELIAATSVVTGFPLVTRDRRMRLSRVVPLAST